jgi:hypothetical protein
VSCSRVRCCTPHVICCGKLLHIPTKTCPLELQQLSQSTRRALTHSVYTCVLLLLLPPPPLCCSEVPPWDQASMQLPTLATGAVLERHHRVARRPASPAPPAGWLLMGPPLAHSAPQAPTPLPMVHHVLTATLGGWLLLV